MITKAADSMALTYRDLINIDDLGEADINWIFSRAAAHFDRNREGAKRIGALSGRTVINLFFEPSTRTLLSFEIAAKRLDADSATLPLEQSSLKKGESFGDTIHTVGAMRPDIVVIRHGEHDALERAASLLGPAVLNAGSGARHHPTQALLDAFTLTRRWGSLQSKRVLICGDIVRSRVAGSNIALLEKLGAEIRLAGPSAFLPEETRASVYDNFDAALDGADAVMMLRIQHERALGGGDAPALEDYVRDWRLDAARVARTTPETIVLHPGPMNRGVEITGEVADGDRSLIREQVESGVAVRMAVMEWALGGSA